MIAVPKTATVELFHRSQAIIGESIWWNADGHASQTEGGAHTDSASGLIEWCDITNGLLHRTSADGQSDDVMGFPPPFSAFQPTVSGGYVASGESTVFTCERDGSNLRVIASVEHRHPGIRFNEGKCDPFGNYVVGSMDVTEGDPDGAIYVVSPDGDCGVLIAGVGVANGFEWSDDGSRMYFTDTSVSTIYVGDYDGAALRNVEPFAVGRQSDGLARDADGGFWNGVYDTGLVVRWDANGHQTHEFDVPAGHVTSVAFVGPELSTLIIATARENLDERQLDDQPLTGSLFRLETGTHGHPVHRFGS